MLKSSESGTMDMLGVGGFGHFHSLGPLVKKIRWGKVHGGGRFSNSSICRINSLCFWKVRWNWVPLASKKCHVTEISEYLIDSPLHFLYLIWQFLCHCYIYLEKGDSFPANLFSLVLPPSFWHRAERGHCKLFWNLLVMLENCVWPGLLYPDRELNSQPQIIHSSPISRFSLFSVMFWLEHGVRYIIKLMILFI